MTATEQEFRAQKNTTKGAKDRADIATAALAGVIGGWKKGFGQMRGHGFELTESWDNDG